MARGGKKLDGTPFVPDERLHKPTPVPPCFQNVWFAFWELDRTRPNAGFGPMPITFTELKSWCELMGEPLDRGDIQVLGRLDRAYLDEASKKLDSDRA